MQWMKTVWAARGWPAMWALAALTACGGGGGGSAPTTASADSNGTVDDIGIYVSAIPPEVPTSDRDAVRLADQASFGPTEALVAQIKRVGAARWVAEQMPMRFAKYTHGGNGSVHQNTSTVPYCDQPINASAVCWRDNMSTEPLVWNFYRNAMSQPDQLRQRVALALQQILVISGVEANGTYGHRAYQNMVLSESLGNYRVLLKKVALSPVMGDYLNNANNDKSAPNENFARELLQLFTIGTCALQPDGTLTSGTCIPTYTNDTVRDYAHALTGWTYPVGGGTPWGCWPAGANCTYHEGEMVPVERYHDNAARTLLSGVSLGAGHTAPVALERVLDSLMAHPNTGPFIGKQLIQHLVSSNPSPAYVARVAAAFNSGRSGVFGSGQRGDLAATVAAVLLDAEARGETVRTAGGKLREPALMFTGVLRAMNGRTDGDALSWWWGEQLQQHMFRPPTVFNYYPADYPVPGTSLLGPTFGIHNGNTALQRLNYLAYMIDWGGSNPDPMTPEAVGTKVEFGAFLGDAPDAGKLVDRMSMLVLGHVLPPTARAEVVRAVSTRTASTERDWQIGRVKTAAYLLFASPSYQVQR
ncbi:MAG: DUF1800 domain-containing protein [Pseudomonadota bacterium]